MRKLFNDEVGFVISAELILVLTIAVLGMVVGLASVRDAINSELVDLSNAFGAIDQSYNVVGNTKFKVAGTVPGHASVAGFGFIDQRDDCDCQKLTITEVAGKTDSSASGASESTNP